MTITTIRCESTREERAEESLLGIKMKARVPQGGRGIRAYLVDPRSELRLGREKRKRKLRRQKVGKKNQKKNVRRAHEEAARAAEVRDASALQ